MVLLVGRLGVLRLSRLRLQMVWRSDADALVLSIIKNSFGLKAVLLRFACQAAKAYRVVLSVVVVMGILTYLVDWLSEIFLKHPTCILADLQRRFFTSDIHLVHSWSTG